MQKKPPRIYPLADGSKCKNVPQMEHTSHYMAVFILSMYTSTVCLHIEAEAMNGRDLLEDSTAFY